MHIVHNWFHDFKTFVFPCKRRQQDEHRLHRLFDAIFLLAKGYTQHNNFYIKQLITPKLQATQRNLTKSSSFASHGLDFIVGNPQERKQTLMILTTFAKLNTIFILAVKKSWFSLSCMTSQASNPVWYNRGAASQIIFGIYDL